MLHHPSMDETLPDVYVNSAFYIQGMAQSNPTKSSSRIALWLLTHMTSNWIFEHHDYEKLHAEYICRPEPNLQKMKMLVYARLLYRIAWKTCTTAACVESFIVRCGPIFSRLTPVSCIWWSLFERSDLHVPTAPLIRRILQNHLFCGIAMIFVSAA